MREVEEKILKSLEEDIKILRRANFKTDEIKRFNRFGQLKENNISKAIRECITTLGHETIIELIDKIDNKKDFIKELLKRR